MSLPVHQDDASILDDERLFRRVHLSQLVKDDDTGLARVSSGVFKNKELSVNIESILVKTGSSPGECLHNYRVHKLISIKAGSARRLSQAVCRDPLPDDPSHGLVYGSKNSKSIHDGLRAAAMWEIPPTAPPFEDIEAEKRILGL
jgi:hypothetical protein